MSQPEHDEIRETLQALEARLSDDATSLEESVRQPSGGEANGGISNAPMHLADLGTDVFMQEIDATVLRTEEFLLGEVRAASQRLEAGTFGTCESCGTAILPERLEVLPYTRHCTACAATHDDSPNGMLETGNPGMIASRRERESAMRPSKTQASKPSSAIGTAGGGTSIGGLAGSTSGDGTPQTEEIETATASSSFEADQVDSDATDLRITGSGEGSLPEQIPNMEEVEE